MSRAEPSIFASDRSDSSRSDLLPREDLELYPVIRAPLSYLFPPDANDRLILEVHRDTFGGLWNGVLARYRTEGIQGLHDLVHLHQDQARQVEDRRGRIRSAQATSEESTYRNYLGRADRELEITANVLRFKQDVAASMLRRLVLLDRLEPWGEIERQRDYLYSSLVPRSLLRRVRERPIECYESVEEALTSMARQVTQRRGMQKVTREDVRQGCIERGWISDGPLTLDALAAGLKSAVHRYLPVDQSDHEVLDWQSSARPTLQAIAGDAAP